jgi:hypothetical protein
MTKNNPVSHNMMEVTVQISEATKIPIEYVNQALIWISNHAPDEPSEFPN